MCIYAQEFAFALNGTDVP